MNATIGMTCLFATTVVFAADIPNAVTIGGTLQKAPCPDAVLLKSTSGTYELSRESISGKFGDEITVKGKIYSKISICKSFPWIDTNNLQISKKSDDQPKSASTRNIGPDIPSGSTVILVSSKEKIGQGLTQAKEIKRTLPKGTAMALGVLATQRELLPRLFAVTKNNFSLMDGIQVMVVDERSEGSVIVQSSTGEKVYSSMQQLLTNNADESRPKS